MSPIKQDLTSTMDRYIRNWKFMSRVYATVSIVLKGALIIASAIVAAKAGLKDILKDLTFTQLGVLVAIGTALDAWLKPREKWKGFMTDHENASDLLMRLKNTSDDESDRIEQWRNDFQAILKTHREKNVF